MQLFSYAILRFTRAPLPFPRLTYFRNLIRESCTASFQHRLPSLSTLICRNRLFMRAARFAKKPASSAESKCRGRKCAARGGGRNNGASN